MVHRGKWYAGNLWSKLAISKEILEHHYCSDPIMDNLHISLKQYVTFEYLKSFIMTELQNENRFDEIKGLTFVPVDKSVKCYAVSFDQCKLKPKQLMKQTLLNPIEIVSEKIKDPVDGERVFWLGLDRDIHDNYYLYSKKDHQFVRHGLAIVRNLEKSLWLNKIFSENEGEIYYGTKLIPFVCTFVKHFQTWEPIRGQLSPGPPRPSRGVRG